MIDNTEINETAPNKPGKVVHVVGEFVNMTPAHARYISASGSGSHVKIAIGRAIDAIFEDKRVKGKRITYPVKFTVTE